jgi:hypothetical protein
MGESQGEAHRIRVLGLSWGVSTDGITHVPKEGELAVKLPSLGAIGALENSLLRRVGVWWKGCRKQLPKTLFSASFHRYLDNICYLVQVLILRWGSLLGKHRHLSIYWRRYCHLDGHGLCPP